MIKNINSGSPINLRTFAPRRDPFDDINENKEKLTTSPSKIPAPIRKSRKPQGVAAGEQASFAIMENKLKTSKNYIEYLKKELRNTDFSSKKALEISNKIIQEEDEARKLDKEICERKEDIERRFRKYYPDNANNAQYDLDRMNAEISAYSSGDLLKYKYLTKKGLGYKPDAFEQAKFEYSPLGKVFTDGLDKSDKNEGLLKRLKNIEDKSNNQLLTIKNIPRPAIKGNDSDDKNNGNFRVDDESKTIQDFKQGLIDKNILIKSGVKKFDKIINKWKQTKDKEIVYKNVDAKVNTKNLTYIKFLKTI